MKSKPRNHLDVACRVRVNWRRTNAARTFDVELKIQIDDNDTSTPHQAIFPPVNLAMDTSATTTDKPPVAFFKKRTAKSNLRKRAAPPPPDSDSQSESTEDESGARVKRRRKAGIAAAEDAKGSSSRAVDAASLRDTQFAADRSATIAVSDDATRKSNWFDDDADGNPTDASLLGTTRAMEKPAADGRYKGLAAYGNFIEKRPDARPAAVGPVKAPTNVRMVTITDFAPDVCKE
jgi:RING finger protein 113A